MTDTDIALLLADAADGVEIGIAPYQAVIRGGRRLRARRWALATAAALVVTGASGTLALASLRDGGGVEVTPAVSGQPTPSSPQERHVYGPQQTVIAAGTLGTETWTVAVDEWGAPRDELEAQTQFQAMRTSGEVPVDVTKASQLVGKSSFFVRRTFGDASPRVITQNTVDPKEKMTGTDLESVALSLDPQHTMPQRLVIGQVATTAQEVTCTWKDGTSTLAHRLPSGADVNSDDSGIRPVAGSVDNWFVCVGPEGTTFDSVKVTG
ncbi:hypothetical protein ACIRU8_11405 [Streptomyces sp. NPDC101175]|uniref:hypothetical protein n=1 Tax=Streptomyces sp. NPDC101175 TaxID=3366123 RepID=UPI0038376475